MGNPAQEWRDVQAFHEIETYDDIDVYISNSATYSVLVKAGSKLLPFIQTEVENGRLIIYDDNQCNFLRTYDRTLEVHIQAPLIDHIICDNSANVVTVDTIKAPRLLFEQRSASGTNELLVDADTVDIKLHAGTGDVICRGKANQLLLFASSYGYSNCTELITPRAWVIVKSTGDAHVYASKRINAFIHSKADIYYIGGATKIKIAGDGSGSLIRE